MVRIVSSPADIDPNTDPELPQGTTSFFGGPTAFQPIGIPVDGNEGIIETSSNNGTIVTNSLTGTSTFFGDDSIGKTTTFVDIEDDPGTRTTAFNEAGAEIGTTTFFGPSDVVAGSTNQGLSGPREDATSGAVNQDQNNFITQQDWRIRLRLAPSANYLYKGRNPGILQPLSDTDGVVFPYTPSITINYAASYDATELVHSNYKVYQYKNSSVDSIQLSCDFTAQDTKEANYLLAVIHFFRSVTKMFYGQDQFPKPGTPPPLCFLIGMGTFQFNDHPLAITNFTYSLPNNVDYIRAGNIQGLAGVNQQPQFRPTNIYDPGTLRLNNVMPGGMPMGTAWNLNSNNDLTVTYVPTQMQIQLQCIPMLSRNTISNTFSLENYANGNLLRGIQNVRGGVW